MGVRAFFGFVQTMLLAARKCIQERLTAPGLILIFVAIDILAWTCAEENESHSKDFKNWVNRYVLPGSRLNCTADDLWAARCGLVHTYGVESRDVIKGNAIPIVYAWGAVSAEELQNVINAAGKKAKAVHVSDLLAAFTNALARFADDLEKQPQLMQRVLQRSDKFLTSVRVY